MNSPKYSLLFMRDDADVRRFRVSPFWLRTFFIVQAVLLVVGVTGLYLGITLWLDNRELAAEKRTMAVRLEEAELKLSSLANMEKILEAYDNRDLQSLLKASEEPGEPDQAPEPEPVDLAEIFAAVDQGPMVVEDLKTVVNDRRAVVTFRLENPSDNLATGVTEIAVVTSDGQMIPVEPQENLSYQIQKRKFERATFELPEGVNQDTFFAVRIEVKDSDGTTIYKKTYPLAGRL